VSRRVSFRPEAEAEALETRDWYEGRRPGLGAEFRAAVEETIERLDNPMQFRLVRGETRRAISIGFPTLCTSAQTADCAPRLHAEHPPRGVRDSTWRIAVGGKTPPREAAAGAPS
jgi:hypothetical protein